MQAKEEAKEEDERRKSIKKVLIRLESKGMHAKEVDSVIIIEVDSDSSYWESMVGPKDHQVVDKTEVMKGDEAQSTEIACVASY